MARNRPKPAPVAPNKSEPRDEWDELFGSEENFEYWLNEALKPWNGGTDAVIAIARDTAAIQNRVAGAISFAAADLELHLRALGLDYLRRGEPLPDGLMDDLAAALELQGSI